MNVTTLISRLAVAFIDFRICRLRFQIWTPIFFGGLERDGKANKKGELHEYMHSIRSDC